MVEYNGEALWQWRNIEYHPVNYINALNETLKSIGYAICPTAHRIGEQLRTSTYRLHNRVKKMNTKKRKDTISGSWFYFSVTEEEMVGVPEDVIRKREWELAKLEKECAEKNEKFEEQSTKVLELLKEAIIIQNENEILKKKRKDMENKGKKISDVQDRQKRRKVKQLR